MWPRSAPSYGSRARASTRHANAVRRARLAIGRALLPEPFQSVAGRTQQRDLGVEDDVDRHARQQFGEAPFVLEGAQERLLLQQREEARRDTPAQVDPAGG